MEDERSRADAKLALLANLGIALLVLALGFIFGGPYAGIALLPVAIALMLKAEWPHLFRTQPAKILALLLILLVACGAIWFSPFGTSHRQGKQVAHETDPAKSASRPNDTHSAPSGTPPETGGVKSPPGRPKRKRAPNRTEPSSPPPATKDPATLFGREPLGSCPLNSSRFSITRESAIQDNGDCGIRSETPVCVIIDDRSYIQRNTGGGVCISKPSTAPQSGNTGLFFPGGVFLKDVRITGFATAIETSEGSKSYIDKTDIEGNGVGVKVDPATPSPLPQITFPPSSDPQ